MNERQDNQNSPKLSDDQMDGLLSAFFEQEVPDQLNQPPSEWAGVRNAEAAEGLPTQPTASMSNRTQRIIAGTASLLAACLLLFTVTSVNPFEASTDHDGQTVEVQEPKADPVIDEDATFNVSSGDSSQAVDDANTSLQEIDNIDLSPESDEEKAEQSGR